MSDVIIADLYPGQNSLCFLCAPLPPWFKKGTTEVQWHRGITAVFISQPSKTGVKNEETIDCLLHRFCDDRMQE